MLPDMIAPCTPVLCPVLSLRTPQQPSVVMHDAGSQPVVPCHIRVIPQTVLFHDVPLMELPHVPPGHPDHHRAVYAVDPAQIGHRVGPSVALPVPAYYRAVLYGLHIPGFGTVRLTAYQPVVEIAYRVPLALAGRVYGVCDPPHGRKTLGACLPVQSVRAYQGMYGRVRGIVPYPVLARPIILGVVRSEGVEYAPPLPGGLTELRVRERGNGLLYLHVRLLPAIVQRIVCGMHVPVMDEPVLRLRRHDRHEHGDEHYRKE